MRAADQGGPAQLSRGDIVWVKLPHGRGAGSRRPALVVQNDVGNQVSGTVIVAAISSRASSRDYPLNVSLPEGMLAGGAEIRLSQLYTIHRSSIAARAARLTREQLSQVDDALRASLGLPRND